MSKSDDYAQALDDLERLRSTGGISQGKYDATRASLLAEMTVQPKSLTTRLLLGLLAVVVIIVLVVIAASIVGTLLGG